MVKVRSPFSISYAHVVGCYSHLSLSFGQLANYAVEMATSDSHNRCDVLIIGAGAAGLLAAVRASQLGKKLGKRVVLLEKNRKPGVKILMSGGTRCNLTHATDRRGIVEGFQAICGRQASFLYAPLAALGPDELIALFEAEGLATKVETTGKVFPASDRALDVQRALLRMLEKSGGELRLDESVTAIDKQNGSGFTVTTSQSVWQTEKLILTTGGQSYPGCGTTGDGYVWAKQLGHRIVPPRPALAPLTSPAEWVHELQGVTIPDVAVAVTAGTDAKSLKKPVATRRGSLLFTHFGLSGPVAMDVSRAITGRPDAVDWQLICDLVPNHSENSLLDEITAKHNARCTLGSVVPPIVPRRLAESLLEQSHLDANCRLAELAKSDRRRFVDLLKRTAIPLSGSLGFKKAEVTAGGIDLKEVDSKTMQSKLVPGLYLAGEILDLDGPIGGYNFQAAFSTGWLAAENV